MKPIVDGAQQPTKLSGLISNSVVAETSVVQQDPIWTDGRSAQFQLGPLPMQQGTGRAGGAAAVANANRQLPDLLRCGPRTQRQVAVLRQPELGFFAAIAAQ